MNLEQMAAADAADLVPVREQMKKVADLVRKLNDAKLALADAEDLVAERRATVRQLEENDIPTALDEAGVTEITLDDGTRVLVEEKLTASIPKKNMDEACAWLEKHGHGSLVRADVVVPLERGDEEKFAAVRDALNNSHVPFERRPNVNTGSVKSLLRELLSEGKITTEVFPLFGAYIRRVATVKPK